MRKNALALVLLMVVALPAYAARNITLPYVENFTTDTLADIRWTSCAGASVTYSTEGWSGGAVKLIPPTDPCASGNGGQSSIGSFQGFNVSRFNVRFLMKVGPTYAASHRGLVQNKFLDVWGANNDRQGILTLEYDTTGGAYFTPGVYPEPSNWTVFRSPGTVEADHYHYNSPFKIFDGGANSNVWVCYEYEINRPAGTATVTITKADGTVATIYSVESSPSSTITSFYLGGYYNGYSVADAGNWLMIDSLAVSGTGTIGPPSGFVGGTPSDTTPNQFTFVDISGAIRSTVYTSNTITVAGIDASTSVSITGGTYSKNGAAYTSAAGTAVLGDTFAVRVTSSAAYSTAVNAVLTIGNVSDTYTVTTLADTVPAFLDNMSPSGVLACTSNPRNVTLSLTTDEAATARMSPTDTTYALMSDTFTTTGGTSHSETKSLACGASYTYYVRTRDSASNDNTTSSTISFSIASPQIAGPGGFRIVGGKIGGN